MKAGDQVVADGTVVSADGLALDEANLTGESEPTVRGPGEPVWSGSFEHVPGLNPLESHRVRAEADRVADLGMLELRQDAVDAVHVEAEQVLDPVVRVGSAAR